MAAKMIRVRLQVTVHLSVVKLSCSRPATFEGSIRNFFCPKNTSHTASIKKCKICRKIRKFVVDRAHEAIVHGISALIIFESQRLIFF